MIQPTRATRRHFLKATCLGAAVTWGLDVSSQAASEPEVRPSRALRLALASYTLRRFDRAATLAMTRRVGLSAICLKDFHLPLDATDDAIAAAVAEVHDAGLTLYAAGVISMRSAEQVDQAFAYARAAGMTHIVAAPNDQMLPRIEERVQEYDIRICIHNHGPGDAFFPVPSVAMDKIQQLDPRIGLCHDIGHTVRYGHDPIVETRLGAERLYDVHFKDVTEASPRGRSAPCGRGVIDLPQLIRTLCDIDYQGYLAFEYEEEPDDPLPGLAESVGYVHGVLDSLA